MLALADHFGQADAIALRPIQRADVADVGRFLHDELNPRLTTERWAAAMVPSWPCTPPNHGFMLLDGDRIVGVQLAYYCEKQTSAGLTRLCNLAALCVLPGFRMHSLRLLRALLSQPGYSFTDLSPSGDVGALNARLGFKSIDTATAMVPNIASIFVMLGMRLIADQATIAATVRGAAARVFGDHRYALGVRHLLLVRGDRQCLVMYRRDRRRNLPLFATVLYVSDPDLFAEGRGQVFNHLLLRHAILFTLMELRVVRQRPRLSILLPDHRPKMFRSDTLKADDIDYLHSELTCVPW